MAEVTRPRLPPLNMHVRNVSTNTVDSDSSDSSPDRENDEEGGYFLAHENDSQSTICAIQNIKEDDMDVDIEQLHRQTPISMLPPELLIAIFSKLTTTADLRNCMLVSYHWALYSVNILWHRPLCNKWSNLQNVARTLADHRPTFPYNEMVKRLNLSAIADNVNDGTAQAFMNCKGIERLTLTSCSKLTDFGVANLVEGSKRLQALDVTDLESLTDRTLQVVANNCSKLQGLNITNCSSITDESLVAVAEKCRQLKRLKLNGVFRVTDASVVAVAQHCRSILEIDLAGCQSITSESVTALLTNLTHLRELRLAHCTDITDTAFTSLAPKLHFDALRILDLTQCEQVRDDAIARIIPAAPRLRNLVLAKCRHITDRAIDAICKLTKNLHYIHLGHCTNLTDTAVINLVKHCSRIRYIDLACCSRLTDASVRHLAQLPKLRRIGLVKCQNLTDSSILALAHGPLTFSSSGKIGVPSQFVSLERVHLSYCVNLTLKGITALLHNCPRLTHLSLTGVQAFLREDIVRFCRDAPSEFTHPQRDVFCVFSGDGVTRLRDFLTQLATEEAEREHQNAIEESLLDPEDSPGADTMSEDGTIDGNDQGAEVVYNPVRHGFRSVSFTRPSMRPRSMQNLSSSHVDMPLYADEQMQRMGPWTPGAPLTPDGRVQLGPAHLNLMSSGTTFFHETRRDFTSRSPAQTPQFDSSEPEWGYAEATSARSQTRRHTMESTSGYFQGPDASFNPYAPDAMRLPYSEADESPGAGPSIALPQSRASISHWPRIMRRPAASPTQSFLRPESGYSAFDANHEAIMSTIPGSRDASRGPSRSDSPQLSRVSSRNRMSNLLNNMRALSSSPLGYADSAARSSRIPEVGELPRPRNEAHREAVIRAVLAADTADQLRINATQPAMPDREIELPLLPPELMEHVAVSPTTPAGSPGARAFASAHQRAVEHDMDEDVNMT